MMNHIGMFRYLVEMSAPSERPAPQMQPESALLRRSGTELPVSELTPFVTDLEFRKLSRSCVDELVVANAYCPDYPKHSQILGFQSMRSACFEQVQLFKSLNGCRVRLEFPLDHFE
jgi:hypothetical protein